MKPPKNAGRKVLLAWNGSAAAAAGLNVAQVVAGQLAATVEILHVWRNVREERAERAKRQKDAMRLGFPIRFETGDAATEIIHATEAPGVLLVALTTHGREMETSYRLGSVAEKVIARTTRPVLIFKPEPMSAATPRGLKRLLVPIDGNPKTAAALQPITELAATLGASIDLLYVAGPRQTQPRERGGMTAPRYVDQPQHEWPEWAGEVIHRLAACCAGCPADVSVRIILVHGDTGEEIARFAQQNQTDAIVLVRRSRFQPGRAGVIRSVLSLTSCPILVVGGEET